MGRSVLEDRLEKDPLKQKGDPLRLAMTMTELSRITLGFRAVTKSVCSFVVRRR